MTATDELLKNNEADDAHVIRSAGGVLTDDEIRSLAITRSVHRIGSSPFIANEDNIRGFVHEVESGKQREVKE